MAQSYPDITKMGLKVLISFPITCQLQGCRLQRMCLQEKSFMLNFVRVLAQDNEANRILKDCRLTRFIEVHFHQV